MHGGLGTLHDGDVVVMVSRGGKTAELMPILSVIKQRGARLIAVTEKDDSPLAQAAEAHKYIESRAVQGKVVLIP